jgi:hypothetical protein
VGDYTDRRSDDAITARTYIDTRLKDLAEQVDRRMETQQRELHDAARLMGARVDEILSARSEMVGSLRENLDQRGAETRERIETVRVQLHALDVYIRDLFEEKQKALDAALIAQKEAVVKAETATERIASRAQNDTEALRDDTTERLAALRRELEAATLAQKRELELATGAQREAIIKAEIATEKRFESTDEWRTQSLERERSQGEERAALAGAFLPRETFQTQQAANSLWRESVEARLNLGSGAQAGRRESQAETHAVSARQVQVAGVVASVVIGLMIILTTVAVATHGFSR